MQNFGLSVQDFLGYKAMGLCASLHKSVGIEASRLCVRFAQPKLFPKKIAHPNLFPSFSVDSCRFPVRGFVQRGALSAFPAKSEYIFNIN